LLPVEERATWRVDGKIAQVSKEMVFRLVSRVFVPQVRQKTEPAAELGIRLELLQQFQMEVVRFFPRTWIHNGVPEHMDVVAPHIWQRVFGSIATFPSLVPKVAHMGFGAQTQIRAILWVKWEHGRRQMAGQVRDVILAVIAQCVNVFHKAM